MAICLVHCIYPTIQCAVVKSENMKKWEIQNAGTSWGAGPGRFPLVYMEALGTLFGKTAGATLMKLHTVLPQSLMKLC